MDRAGADRELELSGEAFARGDLDGVIAHLSAAIRGFTDLDLPREGAVACARLADVFSLIGQITASRVWVRRAERMLADLEPCVEQGWVALTLVGCEVDDPALLLARAELALDRARRFGDLDLEAKALADGGLAHVQAGRVAEGMAMLEEAMALAALVREPLVAGKSVCSFFTACYHAGDVERFGTWTPLLRQQGLLGADPVRAFQSSHCDTVQAALLVELGRWGEAEALLTRSISELEAIGYPPFHPAVGLADLRTLQGRGQDAEALLLGKDQVMQALLPAARLHLARGDHRLAIAAATRGLRAMADDCLRSADLLLVLVEARLAGGDVPGARTAQDDLAARTRALAIPVLSARAAASLTRLLVAEGHPAEAAEVAEAALVELDHDALPWRALVLLVEQTAAWSAAGDAEAAAASRRRADALEARLDVVPPVLDGPSTASAPAQVGATPPSSPAPAPAPTPVGTASLHREGTWWTATAAGTSVRLKDSKGLRYLAELVRVPGTERHALDLVDRIEGVGDVDRRALGDAGPLADGAARTAYRHRIEELRADVADALESGHDDRAERLQDELDHLVAQLSAAFGLGGQARVAGSAAEKARLNVTRAIRAALVRLVEALPAEGAALDRRIRTGLYCCYAPDEADGLTWIVQP